MKTYVADIIPKIQRFSLKLDNLSKLTNQHWVILDEFSKTKKVYIFRNNGELLISINGTVEKAKWEYIGNNSILIDMKEQSFLFKHGFFDDNILALKMDSKEEYAILINESKYKGELNSIAGVVEFLNQNYLVNPVALNKQLGHIINFNNLIYKRTGFTLKMGAFKEFIVKLNNRKSLKVYEKKSNGKYYIYAKKEIMLFPDKETCMEYIEDEYIKNNDFY